MTTLINPSLSNQTIRQEHVTLQDVDISQLYDEIRNISKILKLDIIHEEKEENYWDLKANKGTLRQRYNWECAGR